MGVGYVAYTPGEGTVRQWHYMDKRGYTQSKDSKFAVVIDRALGFCNERKDPWGSVVFVAAKGEWQQFYPMDLK